MVKVMARLIGSVSAAALLALTLAACGGEGSETAPAPDSKAPATEKKTEKASEAKEIHYKCANATCDKTKTTAAGAKPPP